VAPYTRTGGTFSVVVKRSLSKMQTLRNAVDSKVSKVVDTVSIARISSGRGIVRLMRRVQNRQLETAQ
jgi:hypothetical protein